MIQNRNKLRIAQTTLLCSERGNVSFETMLLSAMVGIVAFAAGNDISQTLYDKTEIRMDATEKAYYPVKFAKLGETASADDCLASDTDRGLYCQLGSYVEGYDGTAYDPYADEGDSSGGGDGGGSDSDGGGSTGGNDGYGGTESDSSESCNPDDWAELTDREKAKREEMCEAISDLHGGQEGTTDDRDSGGIDWTDPSPFGGAP